MRNRLAVASSLLAFVSAGCSGKISAADLFLDASSADDASSSDDATDADAGVAVEAGPSCNDLAAQLASLRQEAETCCTFCNSQQCNVAVEDVCCPISVTGSPNPAFTDAVAAYKAQCHALCPATPCARAPSRSCVSSDPQNPSARGECK